MTITQRQPLVLVNTAAAVNSVLTRYSSKIGPKENGSAICDPPSKIAEDHEGNSVVVLTAGLLSWQGSKALNGSDNGPLCSLSLEKELERRYGGKERGVFDEFTTVGLSASVLRRLSLSSGSWVAVKNTLTSSSRPARVMVLDPPANSALPLGLPSESSRGVGSSSKDFPVYSLISCNNQQFDQEVAFLSPILAFNLGIHVSWLEFLTSAPDLEDTTKSSAHYSTEVLSASTRVTPDSFTWRYSVEIKPWLPVLTWAPPSSDSSDVQREALSHRTRPLHVSLIRYATHVRIGLVRIPSGLLPLAKGRQRAIDASLQDYFKSDRFLSRGDIFSVQLGFNHDPLNVVGTDTRSPAPNSPPEFLFFKVLALEPSTEPLLCANHNYTALVLGGSVAAQLPPLARSTHLGNVFLRTPPVQQLTALLAPCLHPRVLPLQLRLSVLIHGPSGSGKQTVVRLAAENLGMHVVEYNCFDFVGATEGKTTATLMNSFKTAKRYSPSLLLLRCLEAFGKSSSTGSSPGDQQASASRITSVLKMCISAHLPSISQENYNDVNEWSLAEELADDNKESSSMRVKLTEMGSGPKEGLVLVVAACESAESLTPVLRRCFTHEVVVGMPNEDQRLALLNHHLGVELHQNDETMEASLRAIAAQTSGLTPRDLRAVAADTGAIAIIRSGKDGQSARKIISKTTDNLTDTLVGDRPSELTINAEEKPSERQIPVQLCAKDLESVLGRVKLRTASAIGTPKVPNVKWEDVGGLEDVKRAILDTVQLPLVHRELFSSGLRQRSGVLLYGPPGTGKTLLAKAVATECALNFLSVKGPELINMYIGESEKNVREIFHKARAAKPCVVFFDELDALAPARGASGDSGGVMDRVVSQMLAEIDGVSDNSQDLFIIGASNRPDLIDPALLRPGRFDKLLYVGVSAENSYRERVLEALTRKFKLDDNVSLKVLAQRCPVTYTGADMYALCADAWQQAVKREVSALERRKVGSCSTEIETLVVKEEDFMKAMGELAPSLSRAELDRYERLRVQFQGQ